MILLTEFLLRLAFGLSVGMVAVPSRDVASGYFRNHLYVILGLSLLAALIAGASDNFHVQNAFGLAATAAMVSYVGSILWLYERPLAGKIALVIIAGNCLTGAAFANPTSGYNTASRILSMLQLVSSGLLLGVTTAAMLLGHWYLNAPGMKLAPLRKLLQGIAIAVGLACEVSAQALSVQDWLFLILRWSFGLLGVMVLIWLAWETLAVPNTQSATGILYVAVMGVFVGETMSLLLSAESLFPI
jgi:hypothetical protein